MLPHSQDVNGDVDVKSECKSLSWCLSSIGVIEEEPFVQPWPIRLSHVRPLSADLLSCRLLPGRTTLMSQVFFPLGACTSLSTTMQLDSPLLAMDWEAVSRGEVQAILLSHPGIETGALATSLIGRSLHLYGWAEVAVAGMSAGSCVATGKSSKEVATFASSTSIITPEFSY